jgi:septal ring factor EnvC (AmiA/AmiB activator)
VQNLSLRAIPAVFAVVASLLLAPATLAAAQGATQRVNPNAKAIAEFQEEINEYVELHRKLERTLPDLPRDASPEVVDKHHRAMERLIQQARKNDGVGDIFESDVRPVLRKLLHGLFSGPEGRKLRMAVMEENPGEAVRLVVNARYPDTVPLSSVPPQILKALPPLPDELEYRFIGRSLILLDVHAYIIADYLTGAVPR